MILPNGKLLTIAKALFMAPVGFVAGVFRLHPDVIYAHTVLPLTVYAISASYWISPMIGKKKKQKRLDTIEGLLKDESQGYVRTDLLVELDGGDYVSFSSLSTSKREHFLKKFQNEKFYLEKSLETIPELEKELKLYTNIAFASYAIGSFVGYAVSYHPDVNIVVGDEKIN